MTPCSAWTLPAYQESHSCERAYGIERISAGISLCPHHRAEFKKKGVAVLRKRGVG